MNMDFGNKHSVVSGVSQFVKRSRKQKLRLFTEYKVMSFAMGATMVFALVFMANSYSLFEKTVSPFFLSLSVVYLLAGLLLFVIKRKIGNDILAHGEIHRNTRLLGLLMLPFICAGNFFAFAAGMLVLKRNPTVEYQVSVYMVVTSILVLLVSSLNVFKEYVAKSYLLGMGILLIATILQIIVTILVASKVTQNKIDRRIIWICPVLLLMTLTGNLFSVLLAALIFKRCRQTNMDVSIKLVDTTRRIFKNQLAVTGALIVIFLATLSICSLLTFDEAVILDNNYSAILLTPRLDYPFGTDDFGRCVFSRIIYGARISLLIGIAAITYPMIVGGLLGALAGYYGGKIDEITMRVVDVIYAIPGVLLAMVIIASFGATIPNLVIALGVGNIASYARITRATVLNMANAEFVEAAKACGANDRVIIFKHILLNSMAPIIVNATIGIGGTVLATSALSYLGIGIPSHIPEWGNILRAGSTYLETNPHLAIFSGLAIMTLVLAFNFFGDGLRDAFDPKLK
jgi:peptide/nickel transport system permease protein